jgi:hypothetical protein
MIDSIKLGILLTPKQHEIIRESAYSSGRKQWILLDPQTGDMEFFKVSGLADMDSESFHRQIRWDIPPEYGSETYLTIELSLPKFWYGHNIDLLYDFATALETLKKVLEENFKLNRRKLPSIMDWQVWRLDYCYAWKLPSQGLAQQMLDSLKHIHYPRKRPCIFPTSLSFVGRTYSVKFYLKAPEFRTHDFPKLIKAKVPLEWINYLEDKADGVLRYEATLRRTYLKRQRIETVKDICTPSTDLEKQGDWPDDPDERLDVLQMIVDHQFNLDIPGFEFQSVNFDKLHDGQTLVMPPLEEIRSTLLEWYGQALPESSKVTEYLDSFELDEEYDQVEFERLCEEEASLDEDDADRAYLEALQGCAVIVKKQDKGVVILQYFLTKFLGASLRMQSFDQVKFKLAEVYKSNKAGKLAAFWLYVQKSGTQDAKAVFGRNPYYSSRADLKKAGVGLVEPPNGITEAHRDFFQAFQLEVPSPFVVNRVDNFRNAENLLNLIPQDHKCDHKLEATHE